MWEMSRGEKIMDVCIICGEPCEGVAHPSCVDGVSKWKIGKAQYHSLYS